jgi:hypothetical protein
MTYGGMPRLTSGKFYLPIFFCGAMAFKIGMFQNSIKEWHDIVDFTEGCHRVVCRVGMKEVFIYFTLSVQLHCRLVVSSIYA